MSRRKMPLTFVSFIWGIPLVILWVVGCSSTPDIASPEERVFSGTDEKIFVGDSLEMTYDPNVIMKRAEAFHEKESYAEAMVEYNHFLDLHRSHVLAPYAQYKLAMSHFKMIKTIDRDPEPIQKAIASFEVLLKEFPENRHRKEAEEKILECQDLLAQHNIFVGQFYFRKEAYLAAAHRFEMVAKTYPYLEKAGDAQLRLAQTFEKLGMPEWSQDWLLAFMKEHPRHELRKEGEQLLAKIQKDNPALVVAQKSFQQSLNGEGKLNGSYPSSNGSYPSSNGFRPSSNGSHPSSNGSYALLAKKETTPSLNGTTPAFTQMSGIAHIDQSIKECRLGTWCESDLAHPVHVSEQVPFTAPEKICQPGSWC